MIQTLVKQNNILNKLTIEVWHTNQMSESHGDLSPVYQHATSADTILECHAVICNLLFKVSLPVFL